MSCNHELIHRCLDDYLEGRLDSALRRQCEQALEQCAECRELLQQAQAMAGLSARWQEQRPPHWNRVRHAVAPRPPGNRLSWAALATSCCTLLLMLFQLEISTENGLLISFGGAQREARLERQLSEQLARFEAENETRISEQLTEFSEAQSTANQLVLAEWADDSRRERRRDMEFLMTSWENQRLQDRRRTEERLSYLARNQLESDQYLNEFIQNADYSERGPL